MTSVPPRIGFIGLGGMGTRMASGCSTPGINVTVYNRTRSRAQDLDGRVPRSRSHPSNSHAPQRSCFRLWPTTMRSRR